MKVVALEPGEVFDAPSVENDMAESPLMAWYFKVVLDDFGIDPA
jgi:hypothetical protein